MPWDLWTELGRRMFLFMVWASAIAWKSSPDCQWRGVRVYGSHPPHMLLLYVVARLFNFVVDCLTTAEALDAGRFPLSLFFFCFHLFLFETKFILFPYIMYDDCYFFFFCPISLKDFFGMC